MKPIVIAISFVVCAIVLGFIASLYFQTPTLEIKTTTTTATPKKVTKSTTTTTSSPEKKGQTEPTPSKNIVESTTTTTGTPTTNVATTTTTATPTTNVATTTTTGTPTTNVATTTTTGTPTTNVATTTTTGTPTTTNVATTTTFKPFTTLLPTTTLSPYSDTISLDASVSSNWSGDTWKNTALGKYSDATKFGGTTTPTLVQNAINGLSALYFDGTNSLAISDPPGTYNNGFTLFIVFQPTDAKTTYQTLVTRAHPYAGGFGIYNDSRQIGSGTTSTWGSLTSPLNIKTLSTNIPYLLVLRVEVINSVPYVSEWFNGTNLYSKVKSTYYGDTASNVYIGNRSDKSSSISYTGYIGSIVMYNKALTDTEVTTTTKTLASKWGIPTAYSVIPTDMTVWLDASSSNTLTAGTWTNTALNMTNDAKPYVGTVTLATSAINGLAGVQFNGTNSLYLDDPATTYKSGFTLFVVFMPTKADTNRTLVSRTSAQYPRPFDMNNNKRVFGSNASSTSYSTLTCDLNLGNLALSTAYVFALRVSLSGTIAYASEWLNGYAVYSNFQLSYYGDTASKIFIGTREDKATSFTGNMGEIIMYKSALTDADVQTTTNYLMGKWGIPNVKEGNFYTVSGSLNQVDIDDDLLCGATSTGVVYCKDVTDPSWIKLPTTQALTQVSVNNGEIYGVDSSGKIYYSANGKNTTAWTQYTASTLSQIDANGDIICGVNSSGVYCKKRTDSGWTKLPGTLSRITVNSDGSLFGVNNLGQAYYKASSDPAVGWTEMLSPIMSPSSISADNDVVCGTDRTTSKVKCADTNMMPSSTWYDVGSTPLEKVSVSKNRIAGVNTSDVIYMT